ncbi:MAG: primosomal protein N' [Parachlamydiales bacterium]
MCPPLIYAQVLLDKGPKTPLTYAIPEGLTVTKGCRVRVPVKSTLREGTVSELIADSPYPAKAIDSLIASPFPPDLLKLAEWLADYTLTPLNVVLRTLLPSGIRTGEGPKTQLAVSRAKSREELRQVAALLRSRSPAQAAALDLLLSMTKEILLTQLCEEGGVTRETVKALEKKGLVALRPIEVERSPLEAAEYLPTPPKTLNGEQQAALDRIGVTLRAHRYETHLLHGVTGSGKTEVYLQAIDGALALGRGAIFLVPEISLTAQTIERIRSRFEGRVALLHHRLSDGERQDGWRRLAEGRAQIAVGPRSALFAPVQNLGLIIVDEEHESSYKQTESAPLYHARDVAVMRGHLTRACVLLGSATPSLESLYNAQIGKYTLSRLTQRADSAALPTLQIVDMHTALARGKNPLFSPQLLDAIEKRFQAGEQSLLFLNRRGYHSLHFCPECRESISCPHCTLSLTYHKGENALACHLCDYKLSPPPKSCPTCGGATLTFKGAGTEQVERSLHAIFPEIRTLRIDADTTRHKGSTDRLFRSFRSGKADLLIGTQMIAKGLHLPQVTLVGVLNSDITLQIPDFRSSENLFQMITQVAGRAGRGALPGTVLIQSWMPDHPTIQLAAKGDGETFWHQELESRRLFNFPPFSRLVKVLLSGPSQQETHAEAERLRSRLAVETLPVTESGYSKVKGMWRFQFLMRGQRSRDLTGAFAALRYTPPKGIRLTLDVDPLSTYF